MLVDVVAEGLVEQAVELAVVAEDDVAALVPREPCRIDVGGRVPAGMVGCLVDRPVGVAQPLELVTAGQPARSGPHHGDVPRNSTPERHLRTS